MATDLFFAFIYTGGLFITPRRKIGFLNRVGWPIMLGDALHKWALDELGKAKP